MAVRNVSVQLITRWALLTGLVILPLQVSGQIENHLILKKNGLVNKMHLLTGDPITFIRTDNDFREEYIIQGIGTSFIIAGGKEVPIKNISCVIRQRTGFNFKSSGKALMIAAPGYLVIGVINSLFQGVSPVPSYRNLIVAGSFLALGAILPGFQEKKYHLGKKFSLKIVQSDPALNR